MERCSISPVSRLTALHHLSLLLLVAAVTPPSACNHGDADGNAEGQVEALSAQLSITAQATPTPLWAVVWGPTQPLEDETHHFLPGQEDETHHFLPGQEDTDRLPFRGHQVATPTAAESWPHHQSAPSSPGAREETQKEEEGDGGRQAAEEEESEPEEEVDPQFYVTVTISSLLILTAVIITAKLCYDRSCSQHPPPLSHGAAPPLSLGLPRALPSDDSRHALQSPPSFTDRERIPVVNL